jgi:hypothetical protein
VLLAGEIVAVYVRARWLMRRRDVPSTIEQLRGSSSTPGHVQAEQRLIVGQRLAWIVSRVLSLLPTDSRCLIRSITLSTLLGRRGIPSRVVIGVRADPAFAAHAWVEYDGHPLLPTGDEYLRLHEV